MKQIYFDYCQTEKTFSRLRLRLGNRLRNRLVNRLCKRNDYTSLFEIDLFFTE